MGHEAHIRAGEVKSLGNGLLIRASKARFSVPIDSHLNSTDHHEASHAVGQRHRGKSMRLVTNIPEAGSLGHMEGEFDAVAAAMPIALGLDGVGDEHTEGSDVYQIVKSGHSLSAVTSAARSIANEKKHHIAAVSTALNRRNTLLQGSVDSILAEVDKGADVAVVVENNKGASHTVLKRGIKDTSLPIPVDLSPLAFQPRQAFEKTKGAGGAGGVSSRGSRVPRDETSHHGA